MMIAKELRTSIFARPLPDISHPNKLVPLRHQGSVIASNSIHHVLASLDRAGSGVGERAGTEKNNNAPSYLEGHTWRQRWRLSARGSQPSHLDDVHHVKLPVHGGRFIMCWECSSTTRGTSRRVQWFSDWPTLIKKLPPYARRMFHWILPLLAPELPGDAAGHGMTQPDRPERAC
jgi:hypothetical protein